MYLKAYTFLDTKTGVHSAPFFVAHEPMALRVANEVGNDRSTTIGRYPADYVLLRVGEFDDNTATLIGCVPVNLGVVAALLASTDQETV